MNTGKASHFLRILDIVLSFFLYFNNCLIKDSKNMAEEERFELSAQGTPMRQFSKLLVSATHPPLRLLVLYEF